MQIVENRWEQGRSKQRVIATLGRLDQLTQSGQLDALLQSGAKFPNLPDDDFDAAVRIAQAEYDQGQPDVVVGSSRGGAVAMNIDSGDTPQVLLCPAWKTWGTTKTVKPNTIILHSRADETVPFADSEELVRNSGLPSESLAAMLRAAERRLK